MFAALLGVGGLALFLAAPRPLSATVLAAGGCVVALAAALGLRAGRGAGLGAPLLEAWLYRTPLPQRSGAGALGALLAGAGVGAAIVAVLRFALMPAVPALRERFVSEAASPAWKQLLIAFESAVLEELVFRLLILSGLVWLVRRLGPAPVGPPAGVVLWAPNLVAALMFGLAHFPRWLTLAPGNVAVLAGVLVLNAAAGVVFGLVFARRGFEAAVAAHFAGDLVLHVLGPSLLMA